MTAPLSTIPYAVVVPTVGRASLVPLLESLAAQGDPRPAKVVIVDDRRDPRSPLDVPDGLLRRLNAQVLRGLGRGPAAARNLGWRVCHTTWVCFLDDDVLLGPGWVEGLALDLGSAGAACGGVQGRLRVPLPAGRRPTDWERSTAGLEQARWATADMAYRREVLEEVGGFDERFPRAYREDADLALRVRQAGWSLLLGTRVATHPVRPTTPGASLRAQRGNTDDSLMRRLHGRTWRRAAGAGRGRLPWHLVTAASAALTVGALGMVGVEAALRSRADSLPGTGPTPAGGAAGRAAMVGGTAYALLTADFARRRIAPGPRTPREVLEMAWTSAAIPVAAVVHRARGWWEHREAGTWPTRARAILFDRDGTLVHDVPYNGRPSLVRPVTGAAEALARARGAGLRTGVVSNQSGVARGLVSRDDVDAVNAEIDARLGPFDTWQVCPHGPDDGCPCRKPAPGLVVAAARALGLHPRDCVVVGDIASDVLAARAAGSRGILVPTSDTRLAEVGDAPVVAPDLGAAVDLVIEGRHG